MAVRVSRVSATPFYGAAYVVVLETVGEDAFQAIERCLDWPLPQLRSVMFSQHPSSRNPEHVPPELRQTVDNLETLYPMLCEAVSALSGSRSDETFSMIDSRLAVLCHNLDSLYYSAKARLARLRSRVITASMLARSVFREGAH
jgi:hypothetical protein